MVRLYKGFSFFMAKYFDLTASESILKRERTGKATVLTKYVFDSMRFDPKGFVCTPLIYSK